MDTEQTIRNSEDIYSSPSLQSLVTVFLSSASFSTGFKVCSASMRGSYGRLRRSPSPLRKRYAQNTETWRTGPTFSRRPVKGSSPSGSWTASLGRRRERLDIRAISSHGGSDLLDITFCHPLTPARIRDSVQNPLIILNAAWSAKVSRCASVLEIYGTTVHLIAVPISTLGGWHPESYRAMG